LNCPVCSYPLIILELNQIEIDYCTSCHGIWLDEGELELLLQDSDAKKKFLDSFDVDKSSNEKSVKCPVCSKKMDKVLCGDQVKVTLDKCSRQHGLWFNEGELQAVVEIGSLDLPERQAGKQDKVVILLKEMFAHNLS
jgi:Zn-finger nucleic acid-binding protein